MSRRCTVVLANNLNKLVSFSKIQSSFPGNPGESRGRPGIQEFLRLLTIRVTHTFFSELRRHHAQRNKTSNNHELKIKRVRSKKLLVFKFFFHQTLIVEIVNKR